MSYHVNDDIAYILTRVPFGISAGPSKFCQISEAIFDLTYDLLLDNSWDPKTLFIPGWKHLESTPPIQKEPLVQA